MKYLMHVAFDGLCFHGTQRQKDKKTVQGELEKVLSKIYDSSITLECCSRLDSDVSAIDFVCAFTPKDNRISKDKLKDVISGPFNGILKVKSIEEVDDSFSPRYSTHSKTYLYLIDLNGEPLLQSHCYQPSKKFDLAKYKEGVNLFLGIHDFELFSSKDDRNNKEEKFNSFIEKIDVVETDGIIKTYITGTNFHRYQIRFMIGAALDYINNKESLESIRDRLNGIGSNDKPRFKVPGKALILYKVTY